MFQTINVKENIPLAEYTTIKIGGSAKYFFEAKTEDDLLNALKEATERKMEYFVLGGGSNIIISDNGFNGLVIHNNIKFIDSGGLWITAGAGNNLNELVAAGLENELTGLEFLAGIPGSVGGAVYMNAGSQKKGIGEFVTEVKFIDHEFKKQKFSKEECEFGYRVSKFQKMKYYITEAKFELENSKKLLIQEKIEESIFRKQNTQDLKHPSAGCIFKNPDLGPTAAQMIEELDLKSTEIGGLQVSPIHANYFINTGGATSEDMIMLISYIKEKVRV
ncbi:UDP-N-acetylmuramate dehydrogenase, partial [Patescibacteria group bacterium]|nr:UDP-N-acetylmuramate dehydrogenase [Patescibacteria group bacterium]